MQAIEEIIEASDKDEEVNDIEPAHVLSSIAKTSFANLISFIEQSKEFDGDDFLTLNKLKIFQNIFHKYFNLKTHSKNFKYLQYQ